jgi:hypothetical protein
MPVMPQKAAGCRMEPPVSVPVAAATRRAATAAALPPDEPPGTRVRSQGLSTGPKAEFSLAEPIANSSQLSLPSSTVPAPGPRPGSPGPSRATTVASKGLR